VRRKDCWRSKIGCRKKKDGQYRLQKEQGQQQDVQDRMHEDTEQGQQQDVQDRMQEDTDQSQVARNRLHDRQDSL
jgi:hypothetical protein